MSDCLIVILLCCILSIISMSLLRNNSNVVCKIKNVSENGNGVNYTVSCINKNKVKYNTTHAPINVPTYVPTYVPTHVPINVPTHAPTHAPTRIPINVPTNAPINVPTRASGCNCKQNLELDIIDINGLDQTCPGKVSVKDPVVGINDTSFRYDNGISIPSPFNKANAFFDFTQQI
jgi:hypothetical protein